MKTKILTILAATALLMLTSTAQAKVYVEPWFGVEFGEAESGSNDDTLTGFGYGFRIGASLSSVIVGLDYALGDVEQDSDPDRDLDLTDVGFFVMLPVASFKVWFAYSFMSEAEVGNSEYEGNAIKFGLGIPVAGNVNLNIEKINRDYDEFNGSNTDFEIDSILVSLGIEF